MKQPSTPQDIRKTLLSRWEKGTYLKGKDEKFPLRISLGRPPGDGFDAIRSWITEFQSDERITPCLQWKEIQHRTFGRNSIPHALLFETIDDLARYLGKTRELKTVTQALALLAKHEQQLVPWGTSHPLELLRIGDDLEKLLTLHRWMNRHPSSGLYLRQIDLPGIDTKFTERYTGVLSAWLDLTLEADDLNTSATRFAERYGFKGKPELIRFRFLDPDLEWRGCSDISIPAEQFVQLFSETEELPVSHVFVVENDISALSFPRAEKSMVLFGRGYSFDSLRDCLWLKRVKLIYWGDLDTHGFRILDQFRSIFPHTESVLMDWKTLRDHESSWGEEPKPTQVDLHHLTKEELDLYDELRFNRIRKNLRLEQEFIRYSHVYRSIGQIAFCLE